MALVAAPAGEFGDTSDIGRRVGMLFTICSVGSLIGPPISGAIHDKYGGFQPMAIYAGETRSYAAETCITFVFIDCFLSCQGSMILFASALMVGSRQTALGRLWGTI